MNDGAPGVQTPRALVLELQDAGAAAVYTDPAHLLQELERSPVGRLLDPARKA